MFSNPIRRCTLDPDIATSPSLAGRLEARKIDLAFFVNTEENPAFACYRLASTMWVLRRALAMR
jgi:hypothetical protein